MGTADPMSSNEPNTTAARTRKTPTPRPIVAFLLTSASVALVTLTLIAGTVSYVETQRFHQGFSAIARDDVNLLAQTAHLVQHSQALVGYGPRFANASGALDLRRQRDIAEDHMLVLKQDMDTLRALGGDADRLEPLDGQRQELMDNLEKLSALLTRRHELGDSLQAQLDELTQNLIQARADHLNRVMNDPDNHDAAVVRALALLDRAWSLVHRVINLRASATPDDGPMPAMTKEIEALLAQAATTLATAPHSNAREIAGRALDDLTTNMKQPRGVLATKAILMRLDRQVDGTLLHNVALADRLTTTVSDLYRHVFANMERRRAAIVQQSERDRWALMVTVLLSGLGGVLILFYVLYLIRRLTRLKTAMTAVTRGEQADIPVQGTDELAEIGRSAQIFVNEISRLALTDPLTGLDNRATFTRRFEESMQMARRRRSPIALLLLNLDRFKPVNDTYGQPVGDAVLQQVARIMVEVFRETDVIARLGGDEFGIILTSLEEGRSANVPARRIVDAISEPIQIGEDTIHIGASIGIVYFPSQGEEVDDLLRKADLALRAAKGLGRNTFQVFDASMLSHSQ